MVVRGQERTMIHRAVSISLAVALVPLAAASTTAAARHAPAQGTTARHTTGHGGPTHTAGHIRFRPGRTAAAEEARRFGAAVGQGCTGKADMARNDHEWVVLCSNGKTYVVDGSTPHAGAPAAECSLAGIGPQPACFTE
jgi:hypothetical protein